MSFSLIIFLVSGGVIVLVLVLKHREQMRGARHAAKIRNGFDARVDQGIRKVARGFALVEEERVWERVMRVVIRAATAFFMSRAYRALRRVVLQMRDAIAGGTRKLVFVTASSGAAGVASEHLKQLRALRRTIPKYTAEESAGDNAKTSTTST